MSDDLAYEVDVMDGQLTRLKEYLPDDVPGSTDVAMLDVENQWADVQKAAEHATAEILGKQGRIDELKEQRDDARVAATEYAEQLSLCQAERDEAQTALEQAHLEGPL